MSVALLFPGQGSQFVGMGSDLFEKRGDLLGGRADEVLGWSLQEMCLEGPEEDLTRTEHAQPALFALAYVLYEELADAWDGEIMGAAGHSLGEFTALCAAGVMDYETALAVVAARGRAMAAAADLESSGMAALIGAEPDLAADIAAQRRAEGGRLQVANINAPGQVVLAGSTADIEWLAANARELGVRRAVPLKVAGAFHSTFMDPAAEQVGEVLGQIEFAPPRFPVWSNTTAQPHTPQALATTLRDQVVSTVRFAESVTAMADAGANVFVHVGPGDVTAGMARRIVPDADVAVVSNIDDIPGAVATLVTMG